MISVNLPGNEAPGRKKRDMLSLLQPNTLKYKEIASPYANAL